LRRRERESGEPTVTLAPNPPELATTHDLQR
jgi:hypothetical protein